MTRTTRPPKLAAGSRRRLDPVQEILIEVVTDGPAKGWVHTHGLSAHGLPELEIRAVPLFLGRLASRLLNDAADFLLNDASFPFAAGDVFHTDRSTIQLVEGCPDEDAGYGAEHYRTPRLRLVDPPESGCECDECTRWRRRFAS